MKFTNTSCQDRLTYVFDLDGVIYRGMELQPHAREVVQTLRSRGHAVRFFTNNSGLSRHAYEAKLASLDIITPIDDIMTSSYATALYLVEQKAVGKTVFKIGHAGISEELEAVGMKVISGDEEPDAHVDYVVVGIDRDFTYRKLARAMAAITAGAKFIATNEDATYPLEGGALVPGAGGLVAAVCVASSTAPFLIGKPSTYAFNKILELTNTPADRSVMVGDRLDTDVAVGNRAGAQSVLVLTGVSTREEAERAVGDHKPSRIINTLEELLV